MMCNARCKVFPREKELSDPEKPIWFVVDAVKQGEDWGTNVLLRVYAILFKEKASTYAFDPTSDLTTLL